MASRGLRNKSTRLSSPATFAAKESAPAPAPVARARESRGTLDSWIEPSMRAAAPSFEDNKGERVGVLEHMEALGRAPTQKFMQKLKLFPPKPSQRSTPIQGEEVTTPTTETGRAETASPAEPLHRSESVKMEEHDMRPRLARTKSKQEEDNDYKPVPIVPPSPVRPMVAQTNVAVINSPLSASPGRHIPPDHISIHVEAAINEAEQSDSLGVVAGLRNLREDANSDPALWVVLDAVLRQSPSRKQFKTFRRYIKAGLKQHSGSPTSNNNTTSQLPSNSTHAAATPSRNFRPPHNFPNSASRSPSGLRSPISAAPLPFHIQRPQPEMASALMSPKAVQPAASSAVTSNGTAHKPSSQAIDEPLVRPGRSRSASSSSSLSSAKSLDAETFAPTIEIDGEATINESKGAKSAGQRQATNRVAAGNNNTKTRTAVSSFPKDPYIDFNSVGNFTANRFKKSKAISEVDQEEVDRQKHELLDRSIRDDYLNPPKESILRSLDSLDATASYIPFKTVPPPVIHPHHVHPATALLSSPFGAQASSEHLLRNGNSRKRSRNEHEYDEEAVNTSVSSSSPPAFLAVPPPGAATSSRSGTPRFARLPPAKKVKKSARVMVSPNKPKNGGITAGFARAGTGKDSATGTGVDDSEEDNNEFCGACGGYGELLCCDGCPNAFHGTCLDPPMDTDNPPQVQWYCPRCVARQSLGQVQTSGILGRIVRRVEEINPKAFNLPFEIREYFEGVKTGDEGEYEELSLPRTQNNNPAKMNRAGFIEEPNYRELRDSKNHIITCYRCNLTSNGRDIIPCDYCTARWHVDCLDPPLAVPPRRRKENPNSTWRCPLHNEKDLASMGRSEMATQGELGRMPRIRKPKHAIPYDVGVTRGFKNNGLIEVSLMKDDEPDPREVEMRSTVYRLSEQGIRLDFIDRIKRSWYEDQTFPRQLNTYERHHTERYLPTFGQAGPSRSARRVHPSARFTIDRGIADLHPSQRAPSLAKTDAQANLQLRAKSFAEQQTVLGLRQLSQRDENPSADKLAELTNALLDAAPPEVQRVIQRSEMNTLMQLQGLLERRMAIVAHEDGVRMAKMNGTHQEDEDESMDDIS